MIPEPLLRDKLLQFLKEDTGMGDITTLAIAKPGVVAVANIISKEEEPFVLAGLYETKFLFESLGIRTYSRFEDGSRVSFKDVVMELEGDVTSILIAERTALNLLTRMSGIATATRKLVEKILKTGAKIRIAATRKTAPGLQYFDKKAVYLGGGDTHRLCLDDAILIKDNHIVIAGGIVNAVNRARSSASFIKKIEVEVKKQEEAIKAAELGVDIIMLDNMSLDEAKATINSIEKMGLRKKVLIEISGGVTEENLLDYVKLKPDIISLGQLTHSAKAVDVSLKIIKLK